MKYIEKIVFIVVATTLNVLSGSFSSDSLEKMVVNNRYNEAVSYIDNFQPKTPKAESAKREIQNNLKYLIEFYRACDSCDSVSNINKDTTDIFSCYKEVLFVDAAGIEGYAFSKSMATSTINKKNEVVQKYNLLVPVVNRISKERQSRQQEMYDSINRERERKREAEFYRQIHIQDSITKYNTAYDSAEKKAELIADSLPMLLELSLKCELCRVYLNKKKYETAIAEERAYSNKYGVVNLSKIDDYKQRIIYCDKTIKKTFRDYYLLTKKQFNYSVCKEGTDCQMIADSLRTIKIDSLRNIYMKGIDSTR